MALDVAVIIAISRRHRDAVRTRALCLDTVVISIKMVTRIAGLASSFVMVITRPRRNHSVRTLTDVFPANVAYLVKAAVTRNALFLTISEAIGISRGRAVGTVALIFDTIITIKIATNLSRMLTISG